MSGPGLVALLQRQARMCDDHGSPLYADLLERCAHDASAGGPVAALLGPWESATVGDAVPLRLMGGVHALVLQRRATQLAIYYPSVGGHGSEPRARWSAFLSVLRSHGEELLPWLHRHPQTNEPGRAAALLGALRLAAVAGGALPVRLFEIGSSAGLNLRVDKLPIGPGLAIDTPLPAGPDPQVVLREGADLHPVDPTSPEGRLRLTAYVWADDLPRFERLRVALDIARDTPAHLVRLEAGQFLSRVEVEPGALTVVWQSVMWQYVPERRRQGIEHELARLHDAAAAQAPFAHVALEPETQPLRAGSSRFEVRLRLSPHGLDGRVGTTPPHGVPVEWVASR